jgi:hypothetical protein
VMEGMLGRWLQAGSTPFLLLQSGAIPSLLEVLEELEVQLVEPRKKQQQQKQKQKQKQKQLLCATEPAMAQQEKTHFSHQRQHHCLQL